MRNPEGTAKDRSGRGAGYGGVGCRREIAGLPLFRLLADRYRGGLFDDRVFVYAAGGYYYPDKDLSKLQMRCKGISILGIRR